MIAEATSSEPDTGLRILARIIARDWARQHIAQAANGGQPVIAETEDHAHESIGSETR